MKRNKKGQFAKKITLQNVALLVMAIAMVGVPMVRASSTKTVSIVKGQAVTIQCVEDTVYTCQSLDCASPTPTPKITGTGDVSDDQVGTIMRHVTAYGGKWTTKQIQYAVKKIGFHNTKVMVAISVAETSMGKSARFKNNYTNYGMKSRGSVEANIDAMASGFNGTYKGLISSGVVNKSLATCYVNGCSAKGNPPYNWIKIVQWSYSQMK